MSTNNQLPTARDAALAAMRLDLGGDRLDELPMEDGEGRSRGPRVYNHPPALTSQLTSAAAAPRNNRWSQAIARGAFNDDDAARVAGIDAMSNGNLARQRRAAETAYSHVSHNYTEKSLGRDRNGYVAPRTAFAKTNTGARRVPRLGHVGDGPIDMEAARNSARRVGPGPRNSNPPRQQTQSPLPQPPAKALPRPVTLQPVAAQVQTASPLPATPPVELTTERQAAQDGRLATRDQVRMVLPAGASVVLQSPAYIQSAAFPQRRNIPGTVFLVTGREASDDMVVFTFNSEDVAEIRHTISEYTDYMTREKGLLLLFTIEGGMKIFYAVSFESADMRESFILSLRKLVDRLNQKTQIDTSVNVTTEANSAKASKQTTQVEPCRPVVKIEPLEPPEKIRAVQQEITATAVADPTETQTSQVYQEAMDHPKDEKFNYTSTKTAEKLALVSSKNVTVVQETKAPVIPRAEPVTTARTPSSDRNGFIVVSLKLIDEIVSWVVQASQYMRECAPEEFSFDTIRAVIRATATAIVRQHYPDFHKMSAEVKRDVVEVQCRTAVEKGFLMELARNPSLMVELAAQDADDKSAEQDARDPRLMSSQQAAEIPVQVPQNSAPPRYQMSELFALRGKAVMPSNFRWLYSIKGYDLKTAPLQAPSFQEQMRQASTTRMDWLNPSPSTALSDSQSDKVAEPFGNVAELARHQEGQVSTLEQHRHASKPVLAVTPGETQGMESGLPSKTASGSQVSAVGGPLEAGKANGFGGQNFFPATPTKIGDSRPQSTSVDPQVENIASFLSGSKPRSQKNAFPSPPSDSVITVYNYGENSHHDGSNARLFSGASVQGSSYSQELSSLFTGDLTQQVAQTTEDLRKLSLGN